MTPRITMAGLRRCRIDHVGRQRWLPRGANLLLKDCLHPILELPKHFLYAGYGGNPSLCGPSTRRLRSRSGLPFSLLSVCNGRSHSEIRRRSLSHGIVCVGDEVIRLADIADM